MGTTRVLQGLERVGEEAAGGAMALGGASAQGGAWRHGCRKGGAYSVCIVVGNGQCGRGGKRVGWGGVETGGAEP